MVLVVWLPPSSKPVTLTFSSALSDQIETNPTEISQALATKCAVSIYRYTRSFSSFPALKNGSFLGLIFNFLPVLGLRPVYPSYSLTKNEYRPRISTWSPLAMASAIPLKKCPQQWQLRIWTGLWRPSMLVSAKACSSVTALLISFQKGREGWGVYNYLTLLKNNVKELSRLNEFHGGRNKLSTSDQPTGKRNRVQTIVHPSKPNYSSNIQQVEPDGDYGR